MLINCPKCGFSQPKDRYCAKCGVDMESFQAPIPSKSKRFASHPAFHIAVLILVVVAAFSFIKQREKAEIEKRIEFLSGGPPPLPTSNSNETPPPLLESSELTNAPPLPNADPALAESAAAGGAVEAQVASTRAFEANANEAETPATLEGEPATTARAATDLPSLVVVYAEVNMALLNRLSEEAQTRGQFESFGEFDYGVLPDIKTKLRSEESNSGVKVLQTIRKNFTALKAPLQWFLGSESGTDRLGLTTLISLSEMTDRDLRGEIEVQRSLTEGTGTSAVIAQRSFPVSFDVPRGAGVFLSGLIRRRPNLSLVEEELFSKSILRILSSQQFKSEETEFVIFFEFDRN